MEPAKLRYAESHEWSGMEGELVVVGITKYAVDLLTDIVFISLPDKGDHTFKGDSFGEIESVKAVSDLYSPVDGEVVEVNSALPNKLETLNTDPCGAGWIAKIKLTDEAALKNLLDYAAYQKMCAEEQH